MADEAYRRAFERKPRFLPLPFSSAPRDDPAMADVVIAGGGPAGATLALLLGRAGLSVELYEAKKFPREKPCGEGIMPAGVAVLERLGLRAAVGGRPLASVRYHGFGMTAESRLRAARRTGPCPSCSASGGGCWIRRCWRRRARRRACACSRRRRSRAPRSRAAARSACASAASCGAAA